MCEVRLKGKTQPIQWTERPGALVAAGSLRPQALALCWLTSDGLVFSGILGPRTSASIKLNSLLGFKSSLLLYLWVPTRRESQFSNLKAKSLQRQAFHFWKLLLAAADARFGIEGEFF
jgi:hypothetical protein